MTIFMKARWRWKALAFCLFVVLLLKTENKFAAANEVVEIQCVASPDDLIYWTDIYAERTRQLEEKCIESVRSITYEMRGKHGPPLDIEVKNKACFEACKQYVNDIEFLYSITGCTCSELDEKYPLSDLNVDIDTWCDRNPSRVIRRELDIYTDWDYYKIHYCQCDPAIGVFCTASQNVHNLLSSLIVLLIYYVVNIQ